MYPCELANVPLGVHVPQVGNPLFSMLCWCWLILERGASLEGYDTSCVVSAAILNLFELNEPSNYIVTHKNSVVFDVIFFIILRKRTHFSPIFSAFDVKVHFFILVGFEMR